MPYYRIVIWTKNRTKPYIGIRQLEQYNIDVVYNQMAQHIFPKFAANSIIDYEVQMLSKNCSAVKKYLERLHSRGKC